MHTTLCDISKTKSKYTIRRIILHTSRKLLSLFGVFVGSYIWIYVPLWPWSLERYLASNVIAYNPLEIFTRKQIGMDFHSLTEAIVITSFLWQGVKHVSSSSGLGYFPTTVPTSCFRATVSTPFFLDTLNNALRRDNLANCVVTICHSVTLLHFLI